MHFKNQSEDFI